FSFRCRRLTRAHPPWTSTGFSCSACARCDLGGRPLHPGTGGGHAAEEIRPLLPPEPFSSGSFPPNANHWRGSTFTRPHRGFTCVRPSGLLLALWLVMAHLLLGLRVRRLSTGPLPVPHPP